MKHPVSTASLRLIIAAVVVILALAFPVPSWAEESCPNCGAMVDPGASFCNQCGHAVESAAPEEPRKIEPDESVVRLVAVHDKEITSVFAAILYGSHLRIDSILGSAIAIAPGEFVTDSGLLAGARSVKLQTATGRSAPAKIVGIDPLVGIALLSAELPGTPPIVLRATKPARLGESLRAIGFPTGSLTGRSRTSSTGVLSAAHRGGMGYHPIEDYIQTDAPFAPGFAGGAVVDDKGRLVGMSTSLPIGGIVTLGPEVGIGLAIPVEWINRSLSWIRAGLPARAWIGARLHLVDANDRRHHGLPNEASFVVDILFPGGPAAQAGLKRGDGILLMQGSPVTSLTALQERLLDANPGERWSVRISRGGKSSEVTIPLKARPAKPRVSTRDALRLYGGVEILQKGSRTLRVIRVATGSAAARSRIRPGDELQHVLAKKDLKHAHRRNARWRAVHDLKQLDELVRLGYSELDFFLGLRFKCGDGEKREVYLFEFLGTTDAI